MSPIAPTPTANLNPSSTSDTNTSRAVAPLNGLANEHIQPGQTLTAPDGTQLLVHLVLVTYTAKNNAGTSTYTAPINELVKVINGEPSGPGLVPGDDSDYTFETRPITPEDVTPGQTFRDKGGRTFTVQSVSPKGLVTFVGADGEQRTSNTREQFARRMTALAHQTPAAQSSLRKMRQSPS
jgi:hypothetical protein